MAALIILIPPDQGFFKSVYVFAPQLMFAFDPRGKKMGSGASKETPDPSSQSIMERMAD